MRVDRTIHRGKEVRDLLKCIATLSPEKRALLELHLIGKITPVSNELEIPRRETSDPCRLSFTQQRLWFMDQLEPNSPAYNISKAMLISGALNVEAMQETLNVDASLWNSTAARMLGCSGSQWKQS